MQDVADVRQFKKINYFEALDYAIDKNKELILNSIKNARRCDTEDSLDIWNVVASMELNGRCRGLSSLKCWCLMVGWCSMLGAWCLVLDAWC